MSKLETVKALNDSGPQLEIIKNIKALHQTLNSLREELTGLPATVASETARALEPLRKLDESVTLLRQDFQTLPDGVASETAQALEPLRRLNEDVRNALAAFDQVTEAQRRTWDEMAREMPQKASETVRQASAGLMETLHGLQASSGAIERTAERAQKVLEFQGATSEGMRQTALMLNDRLTAQRSRLWPMVAIALGSGLISAFTVFLLGTSASNGPAQPGGAMLSAEQLDLMRRGRAFSAAYEVGNQKVKDLLQKKFEEQGP